MKIILILISIIIITNVNAECSCESLKHNKKIVPSSRTERGWKRVFYSDEKLKMYDIYCYTKEEKTILLNCITKRIIKEGSRGLTMEVSK